MRKRCSCSAPLPGRLTLESLKNLWLFALLSAGGLAAACRPDHAPATTETGRTPPAPAAGPPAPVRDTLADARLLAVRRLVAALDARPRRAWSAVRQLDTPEPGEGGETFYYYQGSELRKIHTQRFGETGQARLAFYLLRGRLLFVSDSTYYYNRPIYYDQAAARQEHDTEAFDMAKSSVTFTGSYFDQQGRLLYQTGRVARDSVAVPGYRPRQQQYWAEELRGLLAEADSATLVRP